MGECIEIAQYGTNQTAIHFQPILIGFPKSSTEATLEQSRKSKWYIPGASGLEEAGIPGSLMLSFQTSNPGSQLENCYFLHFLFWNKNVAVHEGITSFSAVLDRMGQSVA